MNNTFQLLLEKLDEPHWKGRTAPDQLVKWGEVKKLIEELAKEEQQKKTDELYEDKYSDEDDGDKFGGFSD